MRRIVVLASLFLSSCAALNEQNIFNSPLVGSWEWVRAYNNCRELYVFQENGELIVISGNRRFRDVYTVSQEPTENGLYKIESTITYNTPGLDCAEGTKNKVGDSYVIYASFNKELTRMVFFYDAERIGWFGPLVRVSH